MIGLLHSVTGRLVVGFALVLSAVLALLASYVGRAERASVLAALDEDLRASPRSCPERPLAAIEKRDVARLDAWADRTAARSAAA
jgi:hypothetical protein